jgi:FtsP/CotA-like multicopper oxidase with cupredoxin domain
MRARLLLAFLSCTLLPACWAAALDPPCPRAEPGSFVTQPQDLYSRHGQLEVRFSYRTRVDSAGKILYCFTDQDGHQSPTLHVRPGDNLQIHLKNELTPNGVQPSMQAMPQMAVMVGGADVCAAMTMSDSSVNIHYHGLNIPPTCHQDEVLKTVVNDGESFDYDLAFPRDEPPGLYWYHPHIHGIAEPAVLGRASGAIVVEGLENVNPAVAGLRQRVLVVRDNELPGNLESDEEAPAWDVSVNYVPVPYPLFTPARLEVAPEKRELWRVLKGCADTILDLELEYVGISQPLQVVGLDGVPVGSQEGLRPGRSVLLRHVLLPPAGRAEFIVTGPPRFVHSAILQTRDVYTGPAGDADPCRTLL